MIIVIAAIISLTRSPLIYILCWRLPLSAACLSVCVCVAVIPPLFFYCFAFMFHCTLKKKQDKPKNNNNFIYPLLPSCVSPNPLIPVVFIHYYFPRHRLPTRQQINISLTLAPLNFYCAYSAACFVVGDGYRL